MGRRERRSLIYAVLLCLAGAGLALFAVTRTWAVEVTLRPAPLPATRVAHTGSGLLPWLPALALVGLAGAGAVLATRRTARRAVGGLVLLVGVAVAAGAGSNLLDPPAGAAGAGWPLLCGLGGLALAAGGALTAARGQRWPAMGARYERAGYERGPVRPIAADSPPGDPATLGPAAAVGPIPARPRDGAGDGPVGQGLIETWDALDRGEDPTSSEPSVSEPDGPRRRE